MEKKRSTPDLYEEIYTQYKNLVLKIANDIVKNNSIAEDILQDTMVKLINSSAGLCSSAPKALKAYVIKTALTISLNRKNADMRNTRRCVCLDDEIIEVLQDSSVPIDDFLIKQEERRMFHSVYSRLDAAERELLNAKYVENLSISEIAEILGCSEDAVKSRLFRAKEHARKLFKDWR